VLTTVAVTVTTLEIMRLSSYLRRKNLTAAEFGQKAGISKQTISKYTLGQRVPRPGNMAKIIAASEGSVTVKDFYPALPRARRVRQQSADRESEVHHNVDATRNASRNL
jgi:transcriptional regulator with XRE-family HTH domain